MNKVILIGNLSKGIELKYLNTGAVIGNTSIAVNEYYKNDKGEKVANTCFIDLVMFGKSAEIANQYLSKGSHVAIHGKLNFETWKDKQGNTQRKHNIIVESYEFLDKRQDNNSNMNANSQKHNNSMNSQNPNQSNAKQENNVTQNLANTTSIEIPF